MELSDILEVTDDLTTPRWVECPEAPGFAVLLRLPDVPGLRGLVHGAVMESIKRAADADPAGKEPGPDRSRGGGPEVIRLRSGGLAGPHRGRPALLLPGGQQPQNQDRAEVEIPFNRELLEVLLKWSSRFYEFVDKAWRDLESQGLKAREGDEKNSLSAPATTPTPQPDNVPGASKKKKNSK